MVVVYDEEGKALTMVDTPWAKAANGKEAATYFGIRDNVLIQHEEHNVFGVVYPVTADLRVERFWWGSKAWFI